MADLLSERAKFVEDWADFLYKYLNLCFSDPYDEKKNPMGYINLGTSVNNLCCDMIYPRITSDSVWVCDTSLLQYRECYGIMRIREAFSNLMTEFIKTHEPVLPENVICLSGVTSCMDIMAHCLGDPGDVFLVPTPMYGRIYTNFKQRSLIESYPIPIVTVDNKEDSPVLTIEKVVKAYENALAENLVVRGVFLSNPSNPLGDIYSAELLMEILTFCHETLE